MMYTESGDGRLNPNDFVTSDSCFQRGNAGKSQHSKWDGSNYVNNEVPPNEPATIENREVYITNKIEYIKKAI